MAQVKMRMFKAASDELDLIGDFEHRDNSYEAHPELYPKLKGIKYPIINHLKSH